MVPVQRRANHERRFAAGLFSSALPAERSDMGLLRRALILLVLPVPQGRPPRLPCEHFHLTILSRYGIVGTLPRGVFDPRRSRP
jgi:hypothetical protein